MQALGAGAVDAAGAKQRANVQTGEELILGEVEPAELAA